MEAVDRIVARKQRRKRLRWVLIVGGAACIVILAVVTPVAMMLSKKKGQTVPFSKTGVKSNILFPLYIYPDATAWDPLYQV